MPKSKKNPHGSGKKNTNPNSAEMKMYLANLLNNRISAEDLRKLADYISEEVNKAARDAKAKAVDQGTAIAWAITFRVLKDKNGFTPSDLGELWENVETYAGCIREGEISLAEIIETLKEEDDIEFQGLGPENIKEVREIDRSHGFKE